MKRKLDPQKLIRDARRNLLIPLAFPTLIHNLYLLIHVLELGSDVEVEGLRVEFCTLRDANDPRTQTEGPLGYALRLATADGELLDEELGKLLSLCDEAFELEALGASVDAGLRARVDERVRARFRTQRSAASYVATAKAKGWSRERWWYADLLGHRPKS